MKRFALPLIVSVGLVACGEKPAETPAPSTNTQSTATESTPTPAPASNLPANAPVVKVVTTGNIPPLEFLNEQGNPQGIEIDMLRAIGEQQGIKFEFYRERFANVLPSLEAGKYQIAASGMTFTTERAGKFGHTTSYLSNPNIIVHKPETKITGFGDLKPLRVGTMHNTVQEKEVDALAPATHDKANTSFQLFQGLIQGKYDAVLDEKYIMEYIVANHPEHRVSMLEYTTDGARNDIVMYTQKSDTELLNKLNTGIDQLKQSGEFDKILANYISVPNK